ncbi:MAG: 4Fe-4S ferredoxin [Candidatus Melainabacteria bacterium RIFOXYA2_FULL_32_9]|nr:MAG: 4Fe-4S ferredoxin [Candidatus Melainabacteria bacterium RIFOXYA2_FULL_32_9]
MKRSIIKVDEEKCTGCGHCIPGCPEGALQIIDGKARLVSDLFCDGLGACIKECPFGAMTVEEREAEEYDEYKVMENVIQGGPNVIKAHLKHLKDHNQVEFLNQAINFLKEKDMDIPEYEEKQPKLACGCPGTMTKTIERKTDHEISNVKLSSELNNWPIQLQLLNSNAPYLKNANLVIAADCTPFAYANFHQRFLKDKVLIMFCPKLDKTIDQYVEKLADIFKNQDIQSVTIVHMEVPCCSGIEIIIKKALELAQKTIVIKDYTISISGEII